MLSNAGVHAPVIPFLDVVGNALSVSAAHIGDTVSKVGVIVGFTVMVKVVDVAHCPAEGVNVYSVVLVLSNAGVHVPAMPFLDIVGSTLSALSAQIGAMASNIGVVSCVHPSANWKDPKEFKPTA